MFKKILVALDHSKADSVLLPRVTELAALTRAEILLLHVSTGWAAHWQDNLNLSDSLEMKQDREYLGSVAQQLIQAHFLVTTRHARGEPARAILETARAEHCDLIAMAAHGHKLIADLIHGTTIDKVRHESEIPIFLVKASPD
jgi:manganese transport protein